MSGTFHCQHESLSSLWFQTLQSPPPVARGRVGATAIQSFLYAVVYPPCASSQSLRFRMRTVQQSKHHWSSYLRHVSMQRIKRVCAIKTMITHMMQSQVGGRTVPSPSETHVFWGSEPSFHTYAINIDEPPVIETVMFSQSFKWCPLPLFARTMG